MRKLPKFPPCPQGYQYNPPDFIVDMHSYSGNEWRWLFINDEKRSCVAQLQYHFRTQRWRAAFYDKTVATSNQNSFAEHEFNTVAYDIDGPLTGEVLTALLAAHRLFT